MSRRTSRLTILAVMFFGFAPCVLAQAWLPPKGQGTLAFSYQNNDVDDHLFSTSVFGGVDAGADAFDLGDIDSQVLTVGGSYGLSKRFAVDGEFAWVTARYTGVNAENPALDDGSFHGAFQDVRIGVRFGAIQKRRVTFTPSVAVVVPSNNYETFGHASVGRGLNELQLGLNAGRLFGAGVARTFLQGNYTYSLVESLGGVSLNRSNAFASFGYFVTRKVTLRSFGSWQETHGGIDWANGINTANDLNIHDRAAAANFYRLGGGASIRVAPDVELYANYAWTIEGENTHDAEGFTLGLAWGFRGALGQRDATSSTTPTAAAMELRTE